MKKYLITLVLLFVTTFSFAQNNPFVQGVDLDTMNEIERRLLAREAVQGVPSGVILMWSGSIDSIPSGWVLCDGNNGTPDLTDRFVIHADSDSGGTNDVGDTGGADTVDSSHDHGSGSYSGSAHTHPQNTSGTLDGNSGTSIAASSSSGSVMQIHTAGSGVVKPLMASGVSSGGGGSVSGASESGGSSTLANVPKYYALAYIMKT